MGRGEVGCTLCCVTIISLIVVFFISWDSISPTEYGLLYNGITKRIDKQVYENGRYFVGPGLHFILFPKTLQTIEFSGPDVVNSRTSDGLTVSLDMSLQYSLFESTLYDMYTTFSADYPRIYTHVARDIISDVSTNFTAYQFFNDQGAITAAMLDTLQEAFSGHMFSDIQFLQLRSVDLPQDFETAIQETIIAQQSITKAQFQLQSAQVQAETMILQAQYAASIAVINAQAQASQITQLATAGAQATYNTLTAEATAFTGVKQSLGFDKADEINQYYWFETVANSDRARLFVGMHPVQNMPVAELMTPQQAVQPQPQPQPQL